MKPRHQGRPRPLWPAAPLPPAPRSSCALPLLLLLAAFPAARVAADSAALFQQSPLGIGASLNAYKEALLEARAERRAAAAAALGGGNPVDTIPRAPIPPPRVIPLPGGFGYINATYYKRPPFQPTGCGDLSPDRECGSPDAFDAIRFAATMEELVLPKGYPLEAYNTTTKDGYILTMYRIPHGRYRNTQRGPKPVVLLVHGVTLASSCYVLLNPNESLAYVLADAGFDVWMANTRGNTYSMAHQTLSPYETAFWRYSIDEVAQIDIPTMIDFVLETTGASKTAYVGHSQGCTLAFALLSSRPEYNSKISVVAHMGPVVFVDDIVAPFLRFAASTSLDQILIDLPSPEFLPTRFTAPLVQTLCDTYPHDEICTALVALIFYGPSQYITPDDYLIIGRTWPSGVAARNLEHWAQQFRQRARRFSYYDFGDLCNRTKWVPGMGLITAPLRESCNQERYGSTVPPEYDLSLITTPQTFFLAEFDVLTMAQDVAEILRRLKPGVAVASFEYAGLGHMDFVWDRNTKHHPELVELMLRYSPGTY